ncbi:MAG: hypothetical protein IJV50_06220 [Lachnospiraceae bacterium]|nr:hypothetical protein [Lachnospiraceae bacterium]
MAREDTVRLLRECNAGVKTGCNSIERVMKQVKNQKFKMILKDSLQKHKEVGNRANLLLNQDGSEEKDPHPCARLMSKCKIEMKMRMMPGDSTAAALIHDGCNMGIRSICKYLNQYPAADGEAKKLAESLIEIETKLLFELRPYL